MRILLITEFFPGKEKKFSGGVETRTFFIAKNLAKKHKIIVISRRKTGRKAEESFDNIKIIRLGRKAKDVEVKFSSILPRLFFIVQSFFIGLKQEVDLVEGSNFICYLPAFFIGKLKKITKIAWYADIYGSEWLKNYGFLTGLFGLILERIGLILPWDRVIALSKQTKEKLVRHGVKEGKIDIVYGGVDLDFIKKARLKKTSLPSVCCIARLVPYKNVDCLIKAVYLIKSEIPEIECVIIGKGPEGEKLRKLSSRLRLKDNIVFKKNLSYKQLIGELRKSYLFCLPSRIEGFGLVTIEALACGTPFVIARTPINKEVTKGKGGLFFVPEDHQDLAEKAKKILLDKKLARKLLEDGKKTLSLYDWRKITQQTEEIYKRSKYG